MRQNKVPPVYINYTTYPETQGLTKVIKNQLINQKVFLAQMQFLLKLSLFSD